MLVLMELKSAFVLLLVSTKEILLVPPSLLHRTMGLKTEGGT